ncbi:Flagellar motor switch protein FliM [Vibrio chagasii]|nr:Flagellar motor switch protein FliM [Vibrio chagasii]
MEEQDILNELGMSSDELNEQSGGTGGDIDFDMFDSAKSDSNTSSSDVTYDTTSEKSLTTSQLKDIQVPLTIELGRTQKTLAELESLSSGDVIGLGKKVNDPVTISCQGKAIAEAEVVNMEGELHLVIQRLLTS